ncbi:Ubiquitin carboxyl-terminal hydrolase 12 [Quillaja saponaria]|uniref:Ubiquitin carboxyl-terminal hydrolase 12 n=1 Tax=Quillaja saponaria TaxID=32244 RepID=A0AAD7QFH2_QUISA|nr:Ubiquitin carboxyl-terminal hydrolase 12 [Quillaja saponaria]
MATQDGISKSVRDDHPSHYTVKIRSFSLLEKHSVEKYESGEFDAGGYKWKLVLYPNGNKRRKVENHISLYLALARSNRSGWDVHATFRLFLLDQNRYNYFMVEDTSGKRFHAKELEWGFDKFISLKDFNGGSNGYVLDDNCVFGAEVFVSKEKRKKRREYLTMMKDSIMKKDDWKIENFSKLDAEFYESNPFEVGDQIWKIRFYPKGYGSGEGNYLSLYLILADSKALPPGMKIYANMTLSILDQLQAKPESRKTNFWFSAADPCSGWAKFTPLTKFTELNNGYLVKDICKVEAKVEILGKVKILE